MDTSNNFLAHAQDVINIEYESIKALSNQLDESFSRACEIILNSSGRTIVIGMGKSGHIGRKIAATFASTGTPAFFVHPAEANHGDMGMIAPDDVVLAISYSGETAEVINLLPLIKQLEIPIIGMSSNAKSTLSKISTVHLSIKVSKEACPLNLAPTASTTASLVMGDALAIAILKARKFSMEDFARYHPGGSLGKRLLMSVEELMHSDDELPNVKPDCLLSEALLEITQKSLGMTVITDEHNKLLGIYTDGDLRRTIDHGHDIHNTNIETVMTKGSITIKASTLAADALTLMRDNKITSLPIVDNEQAVVGVIHMHDLLRIGIG